MSGKVIELLQSIPLAWTVLGALVTALTAAVGFAPRLSDVEERVVVLERVARYQGCRAYLQDKGKDPSDCAVIYRDLEQWLIAPEVRP